MPTLPNCTINSVRSRRQGTLDKFEEEDDWEASNTSSLPTEFDLRPDLTPTNEDTSRLRHFERPVVRASPSQYAKVSYETYSDTDSDEDTLEQVSEIVDQTPSTCQPHPTTATRKVGTRRVGGQRQKISCGKKMFAIVATTILSTLIMLFFVVTFLVIMFEVDSAWFDNIRRLPEFVALDRDYYRPVKQAILNFLSKSH